MSTMKAPDQLVIYDGRLEMKKTREISPQSYLRQQQVKLKWPDGTEVCILPRAKLQEMYDEIEFFKSLMYSA